MGALDAIAAQRAIVGGESCDAFGAAWRDMDERERHFWLLFSRLSGLYAGRKWQEIPGDVRAILKNNLYRGAKRLQAIAAAL